MQNVSVPDILRGDIFRADMNSMRMDMNSMQTVTERTVHTLFSVPFTYSPCSLRKKRQNQAHNCPKLRQPCRPPSHPSACLSICVKRDRITPANVPNYADSNMRDTTLRICVKRDRITPANVPNYVNWNNTNLLYAPLRSSTHLPLRATPSLLPPCVKRDRTIPQTVPNYADCLHNYSAHRRRHVLTNAHAHEYGTIRHVPCRTCYDSTRSRDISHRQRKPNPKTQHITRCRR